MDMHNFRRVFVRIAQKLKKLFPQIFYTRNFGEISVFYAVPVRRYTIIIQNKYTTCAEY